MLILGEVVLMRLRLIMLTAISETQITEGSTEKFSISKLLDSFFDVLDKIELLYGAIPIIAIISIIVICFVSLLSFSRKTKHYTINQINELKKNKKYIPGIFIELNDSKEMLRYFVYGKKWRKRLIANFNLVYDNFYGEILKDALKENDIRFYLDKSKSLKEVDDAIDDAMNLHLNFRESKVDFKSEYDESKYLFEIISYTYTKYFESQQRFSKAANTRYIVLTGSAGNGKTNLLCSISELLVKLNEPVIFMNSRDIHCGITEYMMMGLNVPKWFVQHKNTYWKVINCLLKARQKHLFIIIDAVNENDDNEFGEEVAGFINQIIKYNQVKIIVSCRNEYFEERFRNKLVDGVHIPAYVFDVKDANYNATAIERIMKAYKSYFNYSGNISENVKNVLCEQLLLLRIFFEVNKDSDEDTNTIRKYELFERYIEQVKEDCGEYIIHLMDLVANKMFERCNFDNVSVNDIISCGVTKEEIKNAIDGCILLSKKLIIHDGTILREECENVYFVFDELRDYYLARCLLKRYVNLEEVDGNAIIRELRLLNEKEVSCVEGIIHYCYIFFKTDKEICKLGKDRELCQSVLNLYRITDIKNKHVFYGYGKRTEFFNLGIRIIITSGFQLNDMEMEYIRDCLQKAPHEDGGILFDTMFNGTLYDGINNLDTYLDILFGIDDFEAFLDSFRTCFSYNAFDGYHIPLDLIKYHKIMIKENKSGAFQIQKIAELFLYCFSLNDYKVQGKLEKYFYGLQSHERVFNMMVQRVKQNYSIEVEE